MTEPSHFPYRLFRWFLSRQILLALGLLLILNAGLFLWILNFHDLSEEALSLGQKLLLVGAGAGVEPVKSWCMSYVPSALNVMYTL